MTINENQAIEEMATIIAGTERVALNVVGAPPSSNMLAKAVYFAGYRKQSEGEWVVDGDERNRRAECSNCKHEFATQKGMLQLHRFSYCPNCGAKMKGGAE